MRGGPRGDGWMLTAFSSDEAFPVQEVVSFAHHGDGNGLVLQHGWVADVEVASLINEDWREVPPFGLRVF